MNNNHDREKALLKLKSTYFYKNNKKKHKILERPFVNYNDKNNKKIWY